jgi:NACalpha-BTF3-like transcription factor
LLYFKYGISALPMHDPAVLPVLGHGERGRHQALPRTTPLPPPPPKVPKALPPPPPPPPTTTTAAEQQQQQQQQLQQQQEHSARALQSLHREEQEQEKSRLLAPSRFSDSDIGTVMAQVGFLIPASRRAPPLRDTTSAPFSSTLSPDN